MSFDAYLKHRDEIAELLDPRCYSIEWLDGKVWSGEYPTFANDDAVLVTKLKQFPSGAREIHAMVAAGTLEAISDLRVRAEQWARGMGIEFASVASRPGWARALEQHGYELHQVNLRKEL